jgi:hypothetical protein
MVIAPPVGYGNAYSPARECEVAGENKNGETAGGEPSVEAERF